MFRIASAAAKNSGRPVGANRRIAWQRSERRPMGPAELTTCKEIKDLSFSETIGIPDVSPCLSHCIVSLAADKKLDFEPLEHSVYHGRERLGRYARVAPRRYAAYDANDRLLGDYRKRKEAWAAINRAASGGA